MRPYFPRRGQGALLCAARQPIVDLDGAVAGYELLYRSGPENRFRAHDLAQASRSVMQLIQKYGFQKLCKNRPAFLNCTRETLLEGGLEALPASCVIVEVLEGTEPDEAVRAACARLKERGYLIALDDYMPGDPREPLIEFADILKIDLRQITAEELLRLAAERRSGPCRLLAEKVETEEEFDMARQIGFQYFQGYFIDGPEMLHAPDESGPAPLFCCDLEAGPNALSAD